MSSKVLDLNTGIKRSNGEVKCCASRFFVCGPKHRPGCLCYVKKFYQVHTCEAFQNSKCCGCCENLCVNCPEKKPKLSKSRVIRTKKCCY